MQSLLDFLDLLAADRDRPVVALQDQRAAGHGLHRAQMDQKAPLAPEKGRGGQRVFQLAQGIAGPHLASGAVQDALPSLRLHTVELAQRDAHPVPAEGKVDPLQSLAPEREALIHGLAEGPVSGAGLQKRGGMPAEGLDRRPLVSGDHHQRRMPALLQVLRRKVLQTLCVQKQDAAGIRAADKGRRLALEGEVYTGLLRPDGQQMKEMLPQAAAFGPDQNRDL